jgi:serine/threonine protein kinase
MEHMTFIEAAAWMMSRIADGLAHAHEHGIVHRDLKPANILLSDDGEPLILDFHLSAHRPAEAVMGGTLPYMSPEQLKALLQGGEVGPQSDVYSLGVIFFELLTGATPYPIRTGVLPTVIDQMLADRRQPIPSVRRLNKRVSPDIESIVHRCLADSGQRYQSARQLHEDLLRHLEHRPLRHAANPSLVERGRKWMRRHPQLFSTPSLVALAAAALLTAVGSFGLYSDKLARSAAGEDWRDLQSVLANARTTLNTRFIDQPALEQSVLETKRALDDFDLLHMQDVDETDLFENIAD